MAEVGILQNNHLQTGWGMSTSPMAILADFDKIAINYYQNRLKHHYGQLRIACPKSNEI